MKRLLIAFGMALILSISGLMVCFAAEPAGSDTVAEWELKIPSYSNTLSILDGEDGCYYIYPEMERGIPYVLIYTYEGITDEEEFFARFTPSLANKYSDLEVISEITPITIDGDTYYELDYTYTVGDYECVDRRIARLVDGRIYMFASKEIPELDKTVGSLLEDTIADCIFLAVEEEPPTEIPGPEYSPSDVLEFYWSDFEPELENLDYGGSFYYFDEINAKMWIPDFMEAKELTPANRQAGYIAYFVSADDSEDIAIGVQYYADAGLTDEEYIETIQSLEEVDQLSEAVINDIPFIIYTMPDLDVLVLGTVTASGAAFEVSFYPLSNDDFIGAMEIVAASIQGA